MSEAQDVVVSVGCDWITGTTKTRRAGRALSAFGTQLLKSELHRGCKKKGWGMAGYNGYKVGQVQLGRRDQECIIRLSSHLAHTNWRRVYELAETITRCDWECTTRNNRTAQQRIGKHWRELQRASKGLKGKHKYTILRGSDGSSTLYCGSRTSEKFLRIYDKGRESGFVDLLGSVRYELECKGAFASRVAYDMVRESNEALAVCQLLAGFARARRLVLQWSCDPKLHSGVRRSASDCDLTLAWLTKCVRSPAKLLVDNGRLAELLTALKLDNLVQPKTTWPKHGPTTRRPNYVN
jgi:DNA relaxase NicK